LAKALAHSLLFSGAKLGMSVIAAIGQSDEIEKLARAGRSSFGPGDHREQHVLQGGQLCEPRKANRALSKVYEDLFVDG
jgi:hypothetical protein